MKLLRTLLAALLSLGALAPQVFAQPYPSKPIRVLIPSDAATPPDILMRAMAPALQQSLGQPFVIENRAGANGIIGMEAVAKSPADGYTICITPGAPVSLNPYFYTKLPYEPLKDLAPVINVGVIAASILVSASTPVKSMKELVDTLKAKPQSLSWATWGPGSFSDLYRAWAENALGVQFLEVPYKTPNQAFNAVLTGESHVMLNASGLLPAHVQAGKIRAIATIGPARYKTLPDVPSFAELGYDLDFRGWVGVFAPAGTPREVVNKLNAEFNKVIAQPAFIEKYFVPASVELRGGTPEQFATFLKADRELAGKLVKLTKVTPQ